jgi:putative transposase
MTRPLRVNLIGGWYHVMNRGIERRNIFLDDRDRRHFIELIAELLERFGIETHAYCLMDNHYHLALRTPINNLSLAMKWFGQSYSTWFNHRHGRIGPLFQGRFKSLPVQENEWLWQLTFYIHLNPVHTSAFELDKTRDKNESMGVVAPPSSQEVSARLKMLRNYPWSSLRAYAGYCKSPEWLHTKTVLEAAGKDIKEQKKKYRELLKDQLRRGVRETSFEQFRERIAVGSTEFIEHMKASLNSAEHREIEGKSRFVNRIDFEQVVKAVERIKDEPQSGWIQRHGDWGKWMVLWLAHRYCGLTQSELGKRIGNKDYASVSAGIRRFEKKQESDRKLRKSLNRCVDILNV